MGTSVERNSLADLASIRELGELANADVIVDPAELELDDASREKVANDPVVRRNLDVLRAWAARPPTGRPRRVHVRFYRRPVEVFGDVHVTALRLERTRLDPGGNATGTDEMCTLDAQMVLRSVGYRGLPVVDLPFDEQAGVIPNTSGRVLRGGVPVPGEYVAGWIKRGPCVIGSNKRDAHETVTSLLADASAFPPSPVRDPDALVHPLAERGVSVVTWQGWCAIELAEADPGWTRGRDRVQIADRESLLSAAVDGTAEGR